MNFDFYCFPKIKDNTVIIRIKVLMQKKIFIVVRCYASLKPGYDNNEYL